MENNYVTMCLADVIILLLNRLFNNCIPRQQLGSCSVTRPFLSVRVWLVRLGLDVVCWGSFNTPLASLNVHDSSTPFASGVPSLQTPSSPEDEGLPLLAKWIWNYSSSRIHTCSQFGSQTTLKDYVI